MAQRTYHGSCHCGRVRFEIDAEITRVTRCNCSVCAKKGGLLLRVPPERFRLLVGEDALATYQFNTKVARHLFCSTCGMHPFSWPRAAPDQYTINVRCLDDYDVALESPEVALFDGRDWERAVQGHRFN
jgi:hypothetical protein